VSAPCPASWPHYGAPGHSVGNIGQARSQPVQAAGDLTALAPRFRARPASHRRCCSALFKTRTIKTNVVGQPEIAFNEAHEVWGNPQEVLKCRL